jgi:putative ABC transport system substrate-binding protein
VLLGVLFFALPSVGAGETGKAFKLGTLSPAPPVPRISGLIREALRDLGYVEGRNLIYMERWAGGSEERLHRDAAELVELKVDVIYAGSSAGVSAAANATKTIPIVAIDLESDPVANGWAASLGRPGGNVTGFFLDLPELGGKRLEQLKELVPGLSRVAVLWDASQDRTPLKATEVAARALGLRMVTLEVRRPEMLSRTAVKEQAQAILMMQSPMFDGTASKIATLAAEHRLPIAGFLPFHSESGFLMSYGPDVEDLMLQPHRI